MTVRDFQGGAGFQRDAHQRYLELHGSHGHAGLEQDVSAAGVAADEWVVEIWGDRAAADVLAGEIGCKVIAQVNPSVLCAHKQSTTKKSSAKYRFRIHSMKPTVAIKVTKITLVRSLQKKEAQNLERGQKRKRNVEPRKNGTTEIQMNDDTDYF